MTEALWCPGGGCGGGGGLREEQGDKDRGNVM